MKIRKFSRQDAVMERSPGQSGDILTGNLVDERDGGPITIGYGRWGKNQRLELTLAVDDVMILLEGRLAVSFDGATVEAAAGDIVHMPKGETVKIEAREETVTAYVTYPHWRIAEG
ncbi:cupin domain-containing protein [Falsiroseomonas sp. HC035]|uniref:cupin domain-containing protein n=1 Tax=Falsiroseomonas sp. HC035 TaxID=3390999 RepID=UPI003D319E1E